MEEMETKKHYLMEHGVLVTYGKPQSCHMALFHDPKISYGTYLFHGMHLNTNSVPPFPVISSFKEISEIIDGRERTTSFSPSHVVTLLDTLNWAGFCYVEILADNANAVVADRLPAIIFTDIDRYIELDKWEEISTQQAIEMINQYTTPKKEEEDVA